MKRDNDELYTPKILVDAIMPFVHSYINNLKKDHVPRIWCPFDKSNSEFVLTLKEEFKDCEIIYSHISEANGDFFERIKGIGNVDLVLSNPPFSRKLDIFKALNEYKMPYALCMNLECLNYQIIGNYFIDHPIGLVIPDKKISFDGNCSSFNTSYFCSEDFYKGIVFVHCEHNNGGKNFIPSRMYN